MFDHNLPTKIWDFRAMSLKTWTWVPVVENHARTNTNMSLVKELSDQNMTFLEEHMNAIFSF